VLAIGVSTGLYGLYVALTLVADLRISVREALALLSLLAIQRYPAFDTFEWLLVFTGISLVPGTALLVRRRRHPCASSGSSASG